MGEPIYDCHQKLLGVLNILEIFQLSEILASSFESMHAALDTNTNTCHTDKSSLLIQMTACLLCEVNIHTYLSTLDLAIETAGCLQRSNFDCCTIIPSTNCKLVMGRFQILITLFMTVGDSTINFKRKIHEDDLLHLLFIINSKFVALQLRTPMHKLSNIVNALVRKLLVI